MENKDNITARQDFQAFLEIPKKLIDSLTEVLSHNPDDHNCRKIERDRPSWRLYN